MTMITFDNGDRRFTLRIAGMAMDGDRVLLHQPEGWDFWVLPGGRCELGESSAETLRREMLEELGVEVEVGNLLWVTENFFHLDGVDFHEIGLYLAMRFSEEWLAAHRDGDFGGMEGDVPLTFRWFDRAALDGIVYYPDFLGREMGNLPAAPRHVVQRD